MEYGKLPLTGAGIVVGGIMFDQLRLMVLALALVLVGATLLRLGWRRRKPVDAR